VQVELGGTRCKLPPEEAVWLGYQLFEDEKFKQAEAVFRAVLTTGADPDVTFTNSARCCLSCASEAPSRYRMWPAR